MDTLKYGLLITSEGQIISKCLLIHFLLCETFVDSILSHFRRSLACSFQTIEYYRLASEFTFYS